MDVKQGQNKEGKTVLYLVFEYMDTDLKKFIRSFRQTGDNIPPNIVKVIFFYFLFSLRFIPSKIFALIRNLFAESHVPTLQGCRFLPRSWHLT